MLLAGLTYPVVTPRCSRADEEPRLLAVARRLEQELGRLKAGLSGRQRLGASREEVDAASGRVGVLSFTFCFITEDKNTRVDIFIKLISTSFKNFVLLYLKFLTILNRIIKNSAPLEFPPLQ